MKPCSDQINTHSIAVAHALNEAVIRKSLTPEAAIAIAQRADELFSITRPTTIGGSNEQEETARPAVGHR